MLSLYKTLTLESHYTFATPVTNINENLALMPSCASHIFKDSWTDNRNLLEATHRSWIHRSLLNKELELGQGWAKQTIPEHTAGAHLEPSILPVRPGLQIVTKGRRRKVRSEPWLVCSPRTAPKGEHWCERRPSRRALRPLGLADPGKEVTAKKHAASGRWGCAPCPWGTGRLGPPTGRPWFGAQQPDHPAPCD